jgi:hypothetical protein
VNYAGLRGVCLIAAYVLDRMGARSLVFGLECIARLILTLLANRDLTHLSSILPFKPRFHDKELQHNKTLK